MEKFGREHFKETTDAIETAKRSLQENTEITSELKKKLVDTTYYKRTCLQRRNHRARRVYRERSGECEIPCLASKSSKKI